MTLGRFARLEYVEENTRMLAPQRRIGRRAVQRQIVSSDFYGQLFFRHVFLPVGLNVGEPVVVLG